MSQICRPATLADRNALTKLLTFYGVIHRHLDWRTPLEWLGKQPFWLLEEFGEIIGALAFPPDPPHVAWVRLFITRIGTSPDHVWDVLFPKAYASLPVDQPNLQVALMSPDEWLNKLVTPRGFTLHQEIVLLKWNPSKIPVEFTPSPVLIRPMLFSDLATVTDIDQAAFEPIWQNSLEDVILAYGQSVYATVALLGNQIVGFQFSTGRDWSAHLVRLAVLPDYQGRGVGMALISDLQQHFWGLGNWQLTVNTQNDNHASLSLYQRAGFVLTGDCFPVFTYTPSRNTTHE